MTTSRLTMEDIRMVSMNFVADLKEGERTMVRDLYGIMDWDHVRVHEVGVAVPLEGKAYFYVTLHGGACGDFAEDLHEYLYGQLGVYVHVSIEGKDMAAESTDRDGR